MTKKKCRSSASGALAPRCAAPAAPAVGQALVTFQKRSVSYTPYYHKNNSRPTYTKQLSEFETKSTENHNSISDSNDNDDNSSEMSFITDVNEANTVRMKEMHDYRNRFPTNGNQKFPRNQAGKVYYCYNCGEAGHTHATCRENKKVFCHGCGKADIHTLDCNCTRSQRYRSSQSKNSLTYPTQTIDPNANRS